MIHSGLNLREALAAARRLGCAVDRVTGTGELTVSHPAWRCRMRIDSRRKDAPRSLTGLLRRLERAAQHGPQRG